MALKQWDDRFDFCDDLLEVSANYSTNECCDIVKNTLKSFKGADRDFIQDICNRDNSTFKVRKMYFPYYCTQFTYTYNWEEEETEDKGDCKIYNTIIHTDTNTKTKDFFSKKGIYTSCHVDNFVGRQDQRYYQLSHVNDLDGEIYNQRCIYSEDEIATGIKNFVERGLPNGDGSWVVNRRFIQALFIPVAVVYYAYNGTNYSSVINMHNGCGGGFQYLVSKKTEENAIASKKVGVVVNLISLAISAIVFISTLLADNLIRTIFAGILLLITIVLNVIWIANGKKACINNYGERGGGFSLGSIIISLVWIIIDVIASILILTL